MRFFVLMAGSFLSTALAAPPALNLQPCPVSPALCGTLARPLDPTGTVQGSISIAFQFFPARDAAQGTIVAVEGGPGFATIGSATGYIGLFYPLMDKRNLLLVDNRGTGQSGAIECEPLQSELVQTVADAGRCGAELGDASDLYGTALATDDLAAVIEALGVGPVDLYGDSYGTWFSQAFAVNHPDLVRAVVLDSAYPVVGENPLYPFAAAFNRVNYDEVCGKSLSCRNLQGSSESRIETMIDALRAQPVSGQAYDGNGNLRSVTADATAVAYTMFAGTMGEVIYRDLDAAARAFVDSNDSGPLLRLIAENDFTSGFDQPGGAVTEYSRGLFAGVSCSDYPQIYDMTVPPAQRTLQDAAAIATLQQTNPGIYAPFTIDEFRRMSIDVSVVDLCANWPVPSPQYPPQHSVAPGALFPGVPVLVLSGGLDALTTPEEGRLSAALFPNGKQVLIANSFHVTVVDDLDDCASKIARTFFKTLSTGDTSCGGQITEVRTVPNFATTLAAVMPAEPTAGNQGTLTDLRIAADATLAAGDVISRWWVNYNGYGTGLRGGTYQYSSDLGHYLYILAGIQWTADVSVSGTIDWNQNDGGSIVANLTVTGPGSESGTVTVTWKDRTPHSAAAITGLIGGRAVQATMYAP